MQRLERIFAQTAALKLPEWPSYNNFGKVTQNPPFLKKCKGGTKGNFTKIAQKVALVWKGPKALRRKWHYPSISMHLNCKEWKKFWCNQRLQKCPNGQVMAIFATSPKTCIFGKKAMVRPRETFKKSPRKYPSLQRAKSTLAKMSLSCNLYPLILQRLEKILAHKAALRVPEWPSYGNFCKVTQNPHFLKKCKGRTKGNFSKIAQKVAIVWKA